LAQETKLPAISEQKTSAKEIRLKTPRRETATTAAGRLIIFFILLPKSQITGRN
jgi:hypothetical protein